MFRSTKTLKW